ncbi:Uncharacterised protein [Delftia tsuruhatensis]|uniref:hypothetical protein n=1 Tax=Delftia tsuruhatensis TaxID=180282 RepID=UPI001E819215|nr:hypothetical protein [Delftia tsuruhatensis]CAB5669231.1 Uncharacterised protein [Delftia tsuruhatensis]CAC9682759.1 Uncharacterised protein [Delftia tsuruhatensis]
MAGTNTVYQPITLYVSNAAAGQKIAVQLTANGVQIAFSTGPAFQNIAGVAVTAQSGSLPLSQFSMNSSQTAFLTTSQGGGGGALTFQVTAYLVAGTDIGTFYLRSSSDPGVQVTAAIGNSVPQVVNQTQTLFSWKPI